MKQTERSYTAIVTLQMPDGQGQGVGRVLAHLWASHVQACLGLNSTQVPAKTPVEE